MRDPFRKRTGFNRKKTKLSWGMKQKMYLFLSTQSFIAQISWLIWTIDIALRASPGCFQVMLLPLNAFSVDFLKTGCNNFQDHIHAHELLIVNSGDVVLNKLSVYNLCIKCVWGFLRSCIGEQIALNPSPKKIFPCTHCLHCITFRWSFSRIFRWLFSGWLRYTFLKLYP